MDRASSRFFHTTYHLPCGECSLEVELPPPLHESSADDLLRPIPLEFPPDKLGDPSRDLEPPSGSGDKRGLESRL